jgi:hypothetical protein
MSKSSRPARRWLRFSLATLLFFSLCVCGLLGGYQTGYRAGYNSGQQNHYDVNLVSETYSTSRMIWPDLAGEERAEAVRPLIELIQSTITPEIWNDAAIGADIQDFESAQTLVITAPGSAQREIRELFRQLGDMRSRKSVNAIPFVPAIQSLASRGKSDTTQFQFVVPKSSQIAQRWLDEYYDAGIESVSNSWGRPSYTGSCTDPDFPEWSLDQRIAIWPRGRGLAFLALQNLGDGKLNLIAGWRKES